MIQCPNCGSDNGDLAVVCLRCGGFLQARIPTLDLFSTIWEVIESPKRAMRRIVLAVHKNYALFLSALYGIGLAFFLMWLFNLGERFENLLYLIFAGLLTGPLFGIIHISLLGLIAMLVGELLKVRLQFLNVLGVAAYATVPVILSVVFLLPIELMTFGLFMFSGNPSPFVIKPVSYSVLIVLDGITILWSVALFVVGIRTICNVKPFRAIPIVVMSVGLSLLVLLELLWLIV